VPSTCTRVISGRAQGRPARRARRLQTCQRDRPGPSRCHDVRPPGPQLPLGTELTVTSASNREPALPQPKKTGGRV